MRIIIFLLIFHGNLFSNIFFDQLLGPLIPNHMEKSSAVLYLQADPTRCEPRAIYRINSELHTANFNNFIRKTSFEIQQEILADQLAQRNLMPLYNENVRHLGSDLQLLDNSLQEYKPFTIESSSFIHRTWDSALDFFHGTSGCDSSSSLSKIVESALALCTMTFTKPELQQLAIQLQTDLKPLMWDDHGQIKLSHTPSESRQLDAIKRNFHRKIDEWKAHHGFQQCAQDALNSQYPYHGSGVPNAEQYLRTNGPISPVFADLAEKKAFKDLFELKALCDQGNFEKAWPIVEQYTHAREGSHSIGNQNHFKEYYLKRFYELHDQRGIDKKYLSDPFCKTLSDLPLSQKPSIYNLKLADRDALKNSICEVCHINKPSEYMLKVIYDVIDRHENPDAVIDYICNTLSANHPDAQNRAAYHHFCDNFGRIKFLGSKTINTFKLHANINNAEFASERALLNTLYLNHNNQNTLIFESEFKNYILNQGENLQAGSPEYERLATLYDTYTHMFNGDQIIANLLNQSIADNSLNRDLSYEGLITNYLNSKNTLRCPTIEKEILNAYQDLAQHGERIRSFDGAANPTLRVFCIAERIPVETYEHFQGNQIQYVTFLINRANAEKAAELFAQKMNPTLRKVYEWGAQSNFLAYSFIKTRDYTSAINLTMLAYKTFEYVDKACNQAGYIVVQAVAGIADGFKDMPARLQEILIQIDHNIKNFQSPPFTAQQQPETHYIRNIKQFLQHPIQETQNCCRAIKEKTIAIAKHLHQIGIRGVTKAATQTGIEIWVLRKAENIMEAGRQALLAESNRIVQPVNHVSNSERFIVDAQITQIETTVNTSKAGEIAAAESTALTKVEQAGQVITQPRNTKVPALAVNAIQKAGLNSKPDLSKTSLQTLSAEILSPANQALIKNFNPANYSPEVVNVEKLSKAVEMFTYTKGAMGEDGPLRRILAEASTNLESTGKNGTLRGAAYELEKALELQAKAQEILEFGYKAQLFNEMGNVTAKLDIDIVTRNKFIECKNWDWSKLTTKKIDDFKSSLGSLKKVAQQQNVELILYSKSEIPPQLKTWLIKNTINFHEG